MRRPIAIVLALTLYAAAANADSWQTVSLDTHGSTIDLPDKPNIKDEDVDLGDGQVAKMRTYAVMAKGAAYDVTVSQYPDDYIDQNALEQSLENTRNQLVGNSVGTFKSEAKISIDGHPARDVQLDAMGMDMRCQIVFVGDRQFLVTAITPKSLDPAVLEKFLASFKPAREKNADSNDASK